MTRIVIISKFENDRQIIFELLSSHEDFQIAGTGKDGYDALRFSGMQPDIIVMDMQTDDIDGLELASMIKRRYPSIGIIALDTCEKTERAGRVIRAGISGYLLKEKDLDKLTMSIMIVSHGGYYFSDTVIDKVFRVNSESAIPFFRSEIFSCTFSPLERRILSAIAQGQTDMEIAQEYHIAFATVRNCIHTIRCRTGLKNRTQMVLFAIVFQLIDFKPIQRQILSFINKQS